MTRKLRLPQVRDSRQHYLDGVLQGGIQPPEEKASRAGFAILRRSDDPAAGELAQPVPLVDIFRHAGRCGSCRLGTCPASTSQGAARFRRTDTEVPRFAVFPFAGCLAFVTTFLA